jgi:cytochrome c oxidase subunit 1
MVFLVIIPGIPAAIGNFVLPLHLGAKDVAFPKLNLMSWYMWLTGATFLLVSLVKGAADTGWTFYTPYSTTTITAVIPAVAGAFILGFSSIFTGLNFMVTIHKMRAPGLTWFRLPLFVWGLYATAIMQVLATPVLGITLLMLIVERAAGIGIFDPALGGDRWSWHFFWFYSHPRLHQVVRVRRDFRLIPVFSRAHFRLQLRSALSVDRDLSFPRVGSPHVREQPVRPRGRHLQRHRLPHAIPTAIKVLN